MHTMSPFRKRNKREYLIEFWLFDEFPNGHHWDDFKFNVCSYDSWELWNFNQKKFRYELIPEVQEWLDSNGIIYVVYMAAANYLALSRTSYLWEKNPIVKRSLFFYLGINDPKDFMLFKLRWM